MTLASRRATTALGLAFALAGAVGGCNLIVDSGDYHVGDAAPASTGDASSGSSTGSPDGSGPLADGSGIVPNDSGSGSADAGSDGNVVGVSCGQGLPTIAGSADFAKLVNACVQAVNCDPNLFPANMSGCISNNYLQAIGSVACLATSVDCNGYYGCEGERIATVDECDSAANGASCSGNVAMNCTGFTSSSSVRNCTKTGGTCEVYDSDGQGDFVAACEVVSSCSEQDSHTHCSGNLLYTCTNGVGYGRDCGAINATCLDLGDGSGASCYFNAPACPSAGSESCTGSGDRSICSDVGEYDYGCSRAGLSCAAADDAGTTECLAPGCDPDPTRCSESCSSDGKTANICVGGAPLAIDCTKYGFNSCDDGDLSSNGYVFCIL